MKPGAETVAGCAPNSEITANISQMRRCSFGDDAARTPGTQRYRMQLIADNFVAKQQKQPVPPHAASPDPARPGSTRHLAIGAFPSASMMQSSHVWKRLVHNKCDDRKTSIRHWIKASLS